MSTQVLELLFDCFYKILFNFSNFFQWQWQIFETYFIFNMGFSMVFLDLQLFFWCSVIAMKLLHDYQKIEVITKLGDCHNFALPTLRTFIVKKLHSEHHVSIWWWDVLIYVIFPVFSGFFFLYLIFYYYPNPFPSQT